MIAFLVTLLLASPAQTRCDTFELGIARAARTVYLDPSPDTRRSATRDVIEHVLKPLEDPDILGDPRMVCANEMAAAIEAFADADTLRSEFEQMHAQYVAREQALPGTASERSRRAIHAGIVLAEQHSLPKARRPTSTRALPAPDSLVLSGCPETQHQASALIERLGQLESQQEVFDEIFALPAINEDPCAAGLVRNPDFLVVFRPSSINARCREWAIDQITADPDARRWDPEDVARLVLAARKADRDLPIESFLSRLRPMGLRRAWNLLFPPPSITAYPELPAAPVAIGYAQSQESWHFAFEGPLYADEWYQRRPQPGRGGGLLDSAQARQRYSDERWSEADDAAPHPDLKLVKQAIEMLSKNRKKQ